MGRGLLTAPICCANATVCKHAPMPTWIRIGIRIGIRIAIGSARTVAVAHTRIILQIHKGKKEI